MKPLERPATNFEPVPRLRSREDIFDNPHIDIRDGRWWYQLCGEPPSATTIATINAIIDRSLDLQTRTAQGQFTADAAVNEARAEFFGQLGWDDPGSSFHGALQYLTRGGRRSMPPLDNFIFSQRVLEVYGLHVAHIMKTRPGITEYDHHQLLARLDHMADLGFNPAAVGNQCPRALTITSERFDAHVMELYEAGNTTPNEIIRALEGALMAGETLDEKKRILTARGYDAERILRRWPAVYNNSAQLLASKIAHLEELGLGQALAKDAQLLLYSQGRIRFKLHHLDRLTRMLGWHGDAHELASSLPNLLRAHTRRLRFVAAFALDHWSDEPHRQQAQQLGAYNVNKLVAIAPESLLLAVHHHQDLNVVRTITQARKYQESINGATRKKLFAEAAAQPEAPQHMGERALRAYWQYKEKARKIN